MFDFRLSTHNHFNEACRRFALSHNMKELALAAGMNVQTLRNKLNPEQPHQLNVAEMLLLTDLTEDATLVDGALAQLQCLPCVPVNEHAEEKLSAYVLKATAEVGQLAAGAMRQDVLSTSCRRGLLQSVNNGIRCLTLASIAVQTRIHSNPTMASTVDAISGLVRQFQFIGGAPVTVYRELRRMDDTDTAHGLSLEFAAAHDAADVGDWAAYVNAQGGPFVRRDELAVRTWYQSGDELNEYGEEIVRIKGVYATEVGADTPILTRLAQWKIVPKRAVDFGFDLQGAPAPSRSSVNNCTGRLRSEDSTPPESYEKIDFERMSRKERRQLLARLKCKETESVVMPSSLCEKAVEGGDLALKRIADFAESAGLSFTIGQLSHLLQGSSLRMDGYIFSAAGTGELRQHKDKSSTRRTSDFWKHMKDHHNVDSNKIRHDPIGNYKKMLKEADAAAWKWMFSPNISERRVCLIKNSEN